MAPIINYKKCNHCKVCYNICPTDIFDISEENQIVFIGYPDECWLCGACEIDCPRNAIELEIPLACL